MNDRSTSGAEDSPLGKSTAAPEQYAPQVLFALPRSSEWRQRSLTQCPYIGEDLWTAWELSWLSESGVPQIAVADIRIPCNSPALVESKSLKLYLASLNNKRFENAAQVAALIKADLSACVSASVDVEIVPADSNAKDCREPTALCIDATASSLDQEILSNGVKAEYLRCDPATTVEESLVSHVLKTNCPVTSQPDWASVYISYKGPAVEHRSLLAYLVSYRTHQGFHEACVEQIFLDLLERCKPTELSVYGRYLRRGGIDINPWRSTRSASAPLMRSLRQ